MATLILKRIGTMGLTMLVVSMVVFLLLEINPDGIAVNVLGQYSTPEQRMLWLEQNGYFRPFYERYASWLLDFARGDLGQSIRFKAPVADVLWPRLLNTAVLGATVLAIMVPLSLFLGVVAGMREGSKLDRGISVAAVVTTSVPEFASAVFWTAIFVFWLQWLPGSSSMMNGWSAKEMVLPVLVLVVYDMGYVTRMTRISMADVMNTPYIRTAILKGLPRWRVILRHGLRNALITPFTVVMLHCSWLLSGVIVTEATFAYKGFGALLLEAALNKDIFLLEACAMVAVFVAITSQTISDIGYMFLNPRIRVT